MTVKQLIRLLQKCDKESTVYVFTPGVDDGAEVDGVVDGGVYLKPNANSDTNKTTALALLHSVQAMTGKAISYLSGNE